MGAVRTSIQEVIFFNSEFRLRPAEVFLHFYPRSVYVSEALRVLHAHARGVRVGATGGETSPPSRHTTQDWKWLFDFLIGTCDSAALIWCRPLDDTRYYCVPPRPRTDVVRRAGAGSCAVAHEEGLPVNPQPPQASHELPNELPDELQP